MTDPLIFIAGFVVLALLFGGGAAVLLLSSYRERHPTIEMRRRELNRAVMMEEITNEQYAQRKLALDREAENASLKRRLR